MSRDEVVSFLLSGFVKNFERLQQETCFIPKLKLVINTNYLPTITGDTVFSSCRINVISFDRHFEPQEQDKDLKNRYNRLAKGQIGLEMV